MRQVSLLAASGVHWAGLKTLYIMYNSNFHDRCRAQEGLQCYATDTAMFGTDWEQTQMCT